MDCSPPTSSSMGFPRQKYWSGLPFPFPGDLPHPGIVTDWLLQVYYVGGMLIMGRLCTWAGRRSQGINGNSILPVQFCCEPEMVLKKEA